MTLRYEELIILVNIKPEIMTSFTVLNILTLILVTASEMICLPGIHCNDDISPDSNKSRIIDSVGRKR